MLLPKDKWAKTTKMGLPPMRKDTAGNPKVMAMAKSSKSPGKISGDPVPPRGDKPMRGGYMKRACGGSVMSAAAAKNPMACAAKAKAK